MVDISEPGPGTRPCAASAASSRPILSMCRGWWWSTSEGSSGGRVVHLHGRAWAHAVGSVMLFDQAVGWLRRHRVLLPEVSVPASRRRRSSMTTRTARRSDGQVPRTHRSAVGRLLGQPHRRRGGLSIPLGTGRTRSWAVQPAGLRFSAASRTQASRKPGNRAFSSSARRAFILDVPV